MPTRECPETESAGVSGRVVIVDDDLAMCEVIATKLKRSNWNVRCFSSAEEALASLREEAADVVLTDLNMPGINGLDLCARIAQEQPDVPVVVITAFGSLETAVAAIRAGVYDFVTKPIELDLLVAAIERARHHHSLTQQVRRLSEAIKQYEPFEEFIGDSPAMRQLFDELARISDTDVTVLITGESGTGKELAARALHRRGNRKDKPFLAVNCSALPESLLESELFGHVQGAFTNAHQARQGLLVQANGGTLFLDEVGDLPLALQPKLLRALDERRVRPVGGNQEITFDVRLMAATNRDLEAQIEEGSFRSDLFYRLNVIPVHLPPLRVRAADVLLLAQHFVALFARRFKKPVEGLADATAQKLLAYDWPGNVRELRNAIERAVALTRFDRLTPEDLPEKIREHRASQMIVVGSDPSELVPLDEIDRRYILHVLKTLGGNRTLAAQTLGIARRTLYRKLGDYGVSMVDRRNIDEI